jgi:competence ComEA-like helix-hairpin-helix protein
VENMRDLFTPRQAVKPAAPETAPPAAPEAAPVAPTPAAADTTAKAEPTETVPVEAPPPAAPAVAPAAPPPAAPAQRTPEAVPVRPRRFAPVGWNGTEQSLSAAAAGVDINTASVVDLESLPGVGPARASDIVEFRQKHGSFEHIYDLGRVPGIGANSFRQMTGLSLTSGRDRHCALNKLLGLAEDAAPSLPEIIRLFKERVNALGCVLSGLDGIPLAQNNVAPTQADEYAALSSQLFRRTSRYLRTIAGGEVDCLSLPAADPALLLFATDNAFLVISCRRDGLNVRDFRKAYAIAKEIGWLLSRRAVVRNV